MLYEADFAVYSEINKKQTQCGQNVSSKVLSLLVHATSRLFKDKEEVLDVQECMERKDLT